MRVFVLACLLSSSIPSRVCAVNDQIPEGDRRSDTPVPLNTFADLKIPKSLGQIVERSMPPGSREPDFILIQDLHKHPEAQDHIAGMILEMARIFPNRKVFVEGAFRNIDLTAFNAVPPNKRRELTQRMMMEGDITGAELAVLNSAQTSESNPRLQLIGMEDLALYERNLTAYHQVLELRDQALADIQCLRELQDRQRLPSGKLINAQLERVAMLIRLKLTPEEYQDYLLNTSVTPSSAGITPALKAAEEFYRLVERRSAIFVEKAQRILPAATGPRMIVAGGFHTRRMTELLRHAGKSYIVLSPTITQPGYEWLYERRMIESMVALQEPSRAAFDMAGIRAESQFLKTLDPQTNRRNSP